MAKKGTALAKVERDRRIVADRARGLSWQKIAGRHEVDERTCRRAWQAWMDEEKPNLTGRDPLDVVFELVQHYEAWSEELAEIADAAEQDNNKIGAIKAQIDCELRKTELLQATGILPKQLGKLRVEMDIRYMTTQILALFDKYGMPVDAQRELLAVLGRAQPNGEE